MVPACKLLSLLHTIGVAARFIGGPPKPNTAPFGAKWGLR